MSGENPKKNRFSKYYYIETYQLKLGTRSRKNLIISNLLIKLKFFLTLTCIKEIKNSFKSYSYYV